MKEKKKRNALIIIGLLIACFLVIGVSYAVWQMTLTQTDKNVITTGCFKVEFTDQNPITLDKAYPITDEEGKRLTPYEFTLTNTCDSEATYYINLETITTAEKKLSEEYIKAHLKKEEQEVFSNALNSSYINLDKVLAEASNAYKLYTGKLKAKEITTFSLNLWLDEDTPTTDEVMSATYEGKITVSTSYRTPKETENMMVPMDVKTWYEETIYDDVTLNKTYTQDNKYHLIREITFESELNPYNNAVEVVDFSLAQDRSILGYYVDTGEINKYNVKIYNLYIQADGKIKTNYNASYYGMSQYYSEITHKTIVKGLENLDTSFATNMSGMFFGDDNTSIDLSSFDTSKVTDMSGMFLEMRSLTSLDLSHFDTSNVTDMGGMFSEMRSLTSLDLSHFDTTNVTGMGSMFYGMNNLTSLDLSSFDTSKVTDMSYMFSNIRGLTSLDLSHFNTSNVTDMNSMFYNMSNLTSIDLSNFDTSNVTDMSSMFYKMNSLTNLNLSSFNTQNVTDMDYMFNNARKVTTTLTIRNKDVSYNNIFDNAATEEGSQITLNYTTDTESVVDAMIASKPEDSNVVKGIMIS